MRTTALVLGLVVGAVPARADKTTEQHLAEIGELAIPDVRWEWSKSGSFGDGRLLLSVPLLFALRSVTLFERTSDSEKQICYGHHLAILPRLLIEPQRHVVDGFEGFWRLLGGARVSLLQPASGLTVTGELFGVTGQDQSGGGYGLAVGYGGWLALSYRRTYTTTGGISNELSIDFTLFSLPYGQHMDQARAARQESRCVERWVQDRRFGLVPAPFKGRDESDHDPPVVHHEPCRPPPGENLTITVELYDASAVLEPMVVWWAPGKGQQRISMVRVGESHRFRALLPTASAPRLSYYVEAFDVLANGPGTFGTLEEPVVVSQSADMPACR